MTLAEPVSLSELYEADETAWLESMAERIAAGRFDDLDYPHLREYLTDMARRDRREVKSRLAILLAHVLKWTYQPDRRTSGWRKTVVVQRQKLGDLAGSGVLRAHAEAILAEAYADGVEQAAAETDLPETTFPAECPYALERLLAGDLLED